MMMIPKTINSAAVAVVAAATDSDDDDDNDDDDDDCHLHLFFLSETVNSRVTITFHARLESDLSNLRGRLKPFTVITNEGDAFNGAEGQFTAPVNGAYFFVASAGTYSTDKFVRLQLKQEGTTVSETFAQQYSGHDIMGSCHATLRLTVGQRVWLESENSNSHYSQRSTSFTGFLINADD